MDYDTYDMLNCLKKLQLFLQRSYVAITYIKVIIYNGNAGWDDDVISTQWTEQYTRVTDAYIRVKWATNNLIIRWIMRQILC